jgi:hypothetical protein
MRGWWRWRWRAAAAELVVVVCVCEGGGGVNLPLLSSTAPATPPTSCGASTCPPSTHPTRPAAPACCPAAVRLTAAQALEHPWLREGEDVTEGRPLQGSVVQRLQRFATYSFLKQLVLKIIIDDMQGRDGAVVPPMLTALRDLFNQLDVDSSGEGGRWGCTAVLGLGVVLGLMHLLLL